MVDVSAKPDTDRLAKASGVIRMRSETLAAIRNAQIKKGDVLGTARIAGNMAAKKTSDLIPLCHPLAITSAAIDLKLEDSGDETGVTATATVATTGKTGVEMEAMTAVAIALLTIYDMVKAIDKGMTIGDVRLLEKSGGKLGEWIRPI